MWSGPRSASRSSVGRSTRRSGVTSGSSSRRAGGSEIPYSLEDLYPDALDCLERVRALGLRVGIVGNQTEALEAWARESALPADVISSSASLGVRKPDPAFFEKVVELMGCRAREVAYVGDRVDNDVLPAAAAGLVAVHVRRGPWGRLQRTPPEATLGARRPRLAARGVSLAPLMELRVGIGDDAHALEEGVPLVLGGVRDRVPARSRRSLGRRRHRARAHRRDPRRGESR